MELQEELKQRAIECGLCKQWQEDWGTPDKRRLMEMFAKGVNFCLRHNFPGADYIREHFDRAELTDNGILLDRTFSLQNPKNMIILGESRGNVDLSGFAFCDLHISDTACLELTAKDFARCSVSVYGKARLTVTNDGNNPVYVYRHGGDVTTAGNVVVRDKRCQSSVRDSSR